MTIIKMMTPPYWLFHGIGIGHGILKQPLLRLPKGLAAPVKPIVFGFMSGMSFNKIMAPSSEFNGYPQSSQGRKA
ncbi:hypothetical protein PT286_04825 [Neisseriaceae bacterium ESL0693]|nr:hypothetical protein [Neisseriaceae bacterium ESL0693]